MSNNKPPLLTDVLQAGDASKAGLHRPTISAGTIATAFADDVLNQKIESAIDAVLPAIKRQLHQQLLSTLTKPPGQ